MPLIRRFPLFLALLLWQLPAMASVVEVPPYGLKVEHIDSYYFRVVAVQEFGPAWRADLKAGDVLHARQNHFDAVAADTRLPDRKKPEMRKEVMTTVKNGKEIDLILMGARYPDHGHVELDVLPFNGGRWFDDPLPPRERARTEPGLAQRAAKADAFAADAMDTVDRYACDGAKLADRDRREDEVLLLAYEADGYALAAAADQLPGNAIKSRLRRRANECAQGVANALIAGRVRAFEAAKNTPLSQLVEFPELGVRFRPTVLTFPDGRRFNVLQIHSVEEGGPFWKSSIFRPGDMLAEINETSLRQTFENLKQRWKARPGSEPHVLPFRAYALEAVSAADSFPAPGIEVFGFDHTDIWRNDRKTGSERAREEPSDGKLATYRSAFGAEMDRVGRLGCRTDYRQLMLKIGELDRLAVAAGLDAAGENHEMRLTLSRRWACDQDRYGRVPDAALHRLAALQAKSCSAENGPDQSEFAFLKASQNLSRYPGTVETSIRELMGDENAAVRRCVVDYLLSEFNEERL